MFICKIIYRLSVQCLKSHTGLRQCKYRGVATSFHYQLLRLSRQINKYLLPTQGKLITSVKMAATWSMGPGTLEVPLSLFKKNRTRLADGLKRGQVVVLQGGEDISFYDTDVQYVFRQVTLLLYSLQTDLYPRILLK